MLSILGTLGACEVAPGRRFMPVVGGVAIVPTRDIMSRIVAPSSESWPYRQPSGAGRLNTYKRHLKEPAKT